MQTAGLPLCIMEGMHVTFVRTAACATVAARHILAAPPRSLGLIGCGRLARWTLRMMLNARVARVVLRRDAERELSPARRGARCAFGHRSGGRRRLVDSAHRGETGARGMALTRLRIHPARHPQFM